MLVILVVIEILTIVSLFLFFRGKDFLSIAIMENSFRVYLTFILLILLPLLFIFALYIGNLGIIQIIIKIGEAAGLQKFFMILIHVFLSTAFLIIPVTTIFHLSFSYPQFLNFLRKQKSVNNDNISKPIKEVMCETAKIIGLTHKPALCLITPDIRNTIPGFAGCGIIGKGKNLTLLISEDFVELFQRGILSKREVEAVFLHELSHVLHKDHFIPLWLRSFVNSPNFTLAGISFFLSLFFNFVRTGLSWSNVILAIFALFFVYLFRAAVIQIAAHAMRERE
ncbi:MAG: M48 family metalloprotease, partial [candidate division WOR-3 bacterium]